MNKVNTKTKTERKGRSKPKNHSISLAKHSIKGYPLYLSVLLLWGVYVTLSLTTPSNPQSPINIEPQTLILIKLSIAIPYLITWLTAAYSIIKIKQYSLAIQPSKEAKAFRLIAWGITLLLGSLMLATIISSIRNYLVDVESLRALLTITNNYVYVFPYLAAFTLLFKGALTLARQNGDTSLPVSQYLLFAVPIVLLAYLWLELIFSNNFRVIAGGGGQFASYYLKDSVLVLTLIIPSLISWIVGILAVMQLRSYYTKVTGILYKQSLASLFYGFCGVIGASIFLQALLSLGARRLFDLGLNNLLLLIYIFLCLQVLGFILISRGARNLTKIESV